MGSSSSKKPEITIKAIRTNTEDIRSSLRRKQVLPQNKENLHQTLINNSKQLDTLRSNKSKKKQLEIDHLQKLVSDVSEELLEYNDDHLDQNADESHSFIHVDGDQLKNQKKETSKINKTRKNSKTKILISNPINGLYDIEQKLTKIKKDVALGIKMDDNNLLLLQKKKIEMLSTDLELLNIQPNSPLYEQQQLLEKDLYRYYQKIIRRERSKSKTFKETTEVINEENDKIKINTTKLKSLEIMMEDIHDILQNNVKGDDRCDMKTLLEELDKIKTQLNDIQDDNKENLKSKTILRKKLEQTTKYIDDVTKKKEMNELDEMMDEIDILKTNTQTKNESEKANTLNDIILLRNKLKDFKVISDENITFKQEYINELDNFLKKANPREEVVMRQKKLKSSKSVEDLIHIQKEWKNLENTISLTKEDELARADKILEKLEESIKAKRKSLADVLQKNSLDKSTRKSVEVIRTSAKIYELPKLNTTKSTGNIKETKIEEQTTTPLKYGTIEHALEEMTKISDRVEEIGKEILTFNGTSEDLEYNLHKASLIDKRQILEKLTHKSSSKQVDAFKLEILEKIGYFEDYLNYKLNQNILEDKLDQKLNNLNTKINRFSGVYQNIQYNIIDEELTKCIIEAEHIDMLDKSEKLQKRTSCLRSVLKERSQQNLQLKTEENSTDTKKIITENEDYIQTIKKKLKEPSVLEIKELAILEESLFSKALEIINLNLKNDTPLFKRVKKLLEEIEDCKEIVKTKKIEADISRRNKIFEDAENKLKKMQSEIENFDGQTNDQTYLEIIKTLNDLEIELYTVEEKDNIQEKKLELTLNINISKTRLEQIAVESGIILEIEKRIWEILEVTSDGLPPNDYDKLDEELINLRIRLEKLDVSENLSYRKITCLSYIEHLIKKLNDEHNSRGRQISRSIIV